MSEERSGPALQWRPDRPWNDLPPLPPAAELETRATLKQCITARAALGELKQVFSQPYCRIGNVVDAGIAKRQSASKYLKELAAIGILIEIEAGREKLFIHPKLLELFQQDDNGFRPYEKR